MFFLYGFNLLFFLFLKKKQYFILNNTHHHIFHDTTLHNKGMDKDKDIYSNNCNMDDNENRVLLDLDVLLMANLSRVSKEAELVEAVFEGASAVLIWSDSSTVAEEALHELDVY